MVEDELLIAMELEAILQDGGYEVIGPVATVAGALVLIDRERPGAGVLDVKTFVARRVRPWQRL